MGLTLTTMFLINSYWFGSYQPAATAPNSAGQVYNLPTAADLQRPAVREIDFDDNEAVTDEVRTIVTTPLRDVTFSTWGASIAQVVYKNYHDLTVRYPLTNNEREEAPFLVALAERTPFYYKQTGVVTKEGVTNVSYESHTKDWHIEKTFAVHHDTYMIDCTVSCNPRSEYARELKSRMRFSIPAPDQLDGEAQTYKALLGNAAHTGVVHVSADDSLEQAVVQPRICGVQSNYILHALVHRDAAARNWVQRAYFKKGGNNRLIALLEGGVISEKTVETVSLYIGPKSLTDLESCEPKLAGAAYDGWLQFVALPTMRGLDYVETYTGNYGWALFFLIILMRLVFLPITIVGRRMNLRMEKHREHVAYLRRRYPNEEDYNRELMAFYREKGLGVSGMLIGCFGSIPFILLMFAISGFAASAVEFFREPFLWWISDLSAKDPYYIFPILAGLSFYIATSQAPQQGANSGMMKYMPLIMTVFFLKAPVVTHLALIAGGMISLLELLLIQRLPGLSQSKN